MVVATRITEEVDEEFGSWIASQTAAPTFDSSGQQITPPRVASRSDSGRRLDTHLLTILAIAFALPALRLPVAWLAVCAITAIVLTAVDPARGRANQKGSADLVVVPARAAGQLLRGCINPLNWLKLLLGVLAFSAAGALAGALIAAAHWIAIEGPDGLLAATRMGAWAHTRTYSAVFACYLLLGGVGRTHERRAVALYRRTRRFPEVALAGLTVVLVVASVTLAAAGPRVGVGLVRSSDGLGWVPPGLRTLADGLRDDAVTAELDGVTQCLNGDQSGLWTYHYTVANSLGEPDVATLTADPGRAPDQRALAAAALAAHNHLAPWVEAIEVTVGDHVVLVINRRGLATDEPLTDANELRTHTIGAPEWLSTVAPAVDRGAVLDCSARTPL